MHKARCCCTQAKAKDMRVALAQTIPAGTVLYKMSIRELSDSSAEEIGTLVTEGAHCCACIACSLSKGPNPTPLGWQSQMNASLHRTHGGVQVWRRKPVLQAHALALACGAAVELATWVQQIAVNLQLTTLL